MRDPHEFLSDLSVMLDEYDVVLEAKGPGVAIIFEDRRLANITMLGISAGKLRTYLEQAE